MYASTNELGDNLILGGTPLERTVSQLRFKYFLSDGASGVETARIKFYDDSGLNRGPGQLLYDSGPVAISSGFNFLTLTPKVNVPGSLIWTVQFSGIAPGKQAGLLLFGPPSIGSSSNSFWERVAGAWTSSQFTGISGNFGAQVTAGPRSTLPVLLSQPQNQTTTEGGEVTFSVTVADAFPLQCQWQLNGANLPGATNTSLVLGNVTYAIAGSYTAVVSDANGSVTSAAATLTVVDVKMFAGLVIGGQLGSQYRIESQDALDPGSNWVAQATITLSSSPHWYFDTNSPNHTKRFYRAVRLP
jgi:hypothetical protein